MTFWNKSWKFFLILSDLVYRVLFQYAMVLIHPCKQVDTYHVESSWQVKHGPALHSSELLQVHPPVQGKPQTEREVGGLLPKPIPCVLTHKVAMGSTVNPLTVHYVQLQLPLC